MNQKIKSKLTSISQQAHSALKATDELAALLPRHSSQELKWKEIQQRYRLFADLSNGLTESITDELKHLVATPKETGHDEAGNPTMLIPEMLSTKKSIEEENYERELEKDVENYFKNRPDLEAEDKREEFFENMTHTIEKRNETIERLIDKGMDVEQNLNALFKSAFEELEKNKPKSIPNKKAIQTLKNVIG